MQPNCWKITVFFFFPPPHTQLSIQNLKNLVLGEKKKKEKEIKAAA
jgi:hypothetical protein